MITQGYPLWAVAEDGTAYAVVGWEERDGSLWSVLAELNVAHAGDADSADRIAGWFTFTTADPTDRPQTWPILESAAERNLSDLRQRMAALADRIERDGATLGPRTAAATIREELAR